MQRGNVLRWLAMVVLMISAFGFAFAEAVSHEEEVVRLTYAKVSYAVRLKALVDSARFAPADSSKAESEVRKRELHIILSDFKTGNLSDIAGMSVKELVNQPSGAFQLFIAQANEQMTDSGGITISSSLAAEPKWQQEPVGGAEDWATPISKALPMVEKQNNNVRLTRYCSYTVSVEFAGKARVYRATMFFGEDSQGREAVVPGDLVMNNGGAFSFFMKNPVRPDVLVRNSHSSSAVRDWIAAHNVVHCPAASKEACCDPVTLECSIGGLQ